MSHVAPRSQVAPQFPPAQSNVQVVEPLQLKLQLPPAHDTVHELAPSQLNPHPP